MTESELQALISNANPSEQVTITVPAGTMSLTSGIRVERNGVRLVFEGTWLETDAPGLTGVYASGIDVDIEGMATVRAGTHAPAVGWEAHNLVDSRWSGFSAEDCDTALLIEATASCTRNVFRPRRLWGWTTAAVRTVKSGAGFARHCSVIGGHIFHPAPDSNTGPAWDINTAQFTIAHTNTETPGPAPHGAHITEPSCQLIATRWEGVFGIHLSGDAYRTRIVGGAGIGPASVFCSGNGAAQLVSLDSNGHTVSTVP